jgi:hypothetical protein
VSAQIGAEHRQRTPERTPHRNGDRARDGDTGGRHDRPADPGSVRQLPALVPGARRRAERAWSRAPPRMAPAGLGSCPAWSPVACPASSWSSATPTRAWSTPSPARSLARAGSAAAPFPAQPAGQGPTARPAPWVVIGARTWSRSRSPKLTNPIPLGPCEVTGAVATHDCTLPSCPAPFRWARRSSRARRCAPSRRRRR